MKQYHQPTIEIIRLEAGMTMVDPALTGSSQTGSQSQNLAPERRDKELF